jgi:hypothetical protein
MRLGRLGTGGSAGNGQLTAAAGAVLLVLFAAELATLVRLGPLLTVHVFVGILLVPVVALKLASAGWRMLRYYVGRDDYVRHGPPHVALRALVAPVLVAATVSLLGSGIALVALDRTGGPLAALHQAGFVVWIGAIGVHVLAHALELPRLLRARLPGLVLRVGAVAAVVALGGLAATATIPRADRLQDHVAARAHVDAD